VKVTVNNRAGVEHKTKSPHPYFLIRIIPHAVVLFKKNLPEP